MNQNSNTFEGIVLSGGGTKGILTLGALHYYYEKGLYTKDAARVYSATSIGSVISLLLLCGYAPIDIFSSIYSTQNIFKIPTVISIQDITQNIGLLPIDSFSNKVKEMIINKLGYIPSLQQLYEITNKKLIVAASNISKLRPEYFVYDTYPKLSSLRAVELSCCLPIIFYRMKYGDDYISDGALSNNFPIDQINDGTKKILAIVTQDFCADTSDAHITSVSNKGSDDTAYCSTDVRYINDSCVNSVNNNAHKTTNIINYDDFVNYFYRLVSLPMKINNQLRVDLCGNNVTLIKIKYKSDLLELDITEEKKMDMFLTGYQTAEYKDTVEYLYVKDFCV